MNQRRSLTGHRTTFVLARTQQCNVEVTRTKFSGEQIYDYEATSGLFRKAMENVSDEMFPGDPALAARVIYEVLKSNRKLHRIIIGSDAYKNIGGKLAALRADYETNDAWAHSTDFKE